MVRIQRTDDLDEVVYPKTPGNGPPIARVDFNALHKTMNDEASPMADRLEAAHRLLPYHHEVKPVKLVPWPANHPR